MSSIAHALTSDEFLADDQLATDEIGSEYVRRGELPPISILANLRSARLPPRELAILAPKRQRTAGSFD